MAQMHKLAHLQRQLGTHSLVIIQYRVQLALGLLQITRY